jgi:methylmalonyl-CoA mutase cobalamin-binding domain/chain
MHTHKHDVGETTMTDLSVAKKLVAYKPKNKVRFVTAAALFDGHDASINIMRRILQSTGSEVIHLGHNRSVGEIVNAALQEDVQGIAITSYQGGHVEFFKYMIDLLRENGGENIKVFGGGGGVIVPAEIKELHDYGVTRIYSPEDGAVLGLQGMINDLVERCDEDLSVAGPRAPTPSSPPSSPATAGPWPGHHRPRERRLRRRRQAALIEAAKASRCRPSASPAPAAPASPASPTNWCAASASTRTTSSSSPSSPSTRRASAPAARCWATASA